MLDINWKIGGIGGMGAMGVGLIFSKTLSRAGYSICDYNEYNSVIKGGHNTYQVRVSNQKVYSISQSINILLALDEYSLTYFSNLDKNNGFVLCDWALVKNKEAFDINNIIDIPFSIINKNNGGDEIMKNIVGLGASLALVGVDIEIPKLLIAEQFGKKGQEIIDKNNVLLLAGYNYILEKFPENINKFILSNGKFETTTNNSSPHVLTGNEAIALGAINSGVGYYAAYPMTPSSSILHFLASVVSKYNIIVKHAEDEISAINSAIGASYAGARAMVATSGGGFSLMVEALGLAAITETPIVIGMISRPGPSTGLPTWTDQSDLRFVLHASQGEFIRIVLTPGDVNEHFELTKLSFELSEKYQIPVIILSDKYMAEGHWNCYIDPNLQDNSKRKGFISDIALSRIEYYERYGDTSSGISPRSIPSMVKGEFIANSDEHDFYGYSVETQEMRDIQMKKRYDKKLIRLKQDMPKHTILGNVESKVGVICFGSVKNQMLEVFKYINNVKCLPIKYVSPFPLDDVKQFIESCKKIIVIENNYTGQLCGLITEYTGKFPDAKLLKDNGQPFFYEEILNFLNTNGHI